VHHRGSRSLALECEVSWPFMVSQLQAMRAGDPDAAQVEAAMNAELAKLPESPDEKLR